MPITNQKYAFVTAQGWESSLCERWPNAPQYGDYRLLVFAGSDLPRLESEYSNVDFKYLEASETIEQMGLGAIWPLICNLEQAREIAEYFTPDEELTNEN